MSDIERVIEHIEQRLLGKRNEIRLAVCCLLSGGHLLIEDLPGVGKTTLSHALASSFGLAFSRIQFTSDLLPADILGFSTFNQQSDQLSFQAGPIFSQVVLADEINRASPKSQSALLEAMEEHQVSVDGQTHPLPEPFFVIATQNPLHHTGTYPLPESQLDRFLMRLHLGYPDATAEKDMLRQSQADNTALSALLSPDGLRTLQNQASLVSASDAIIDYIIRLVNATRKDEQWGHPLSPRASKAILRAARSWAFIDGQQHVLPDHVKAIFPAVCEHRLRNGQSSGVDYPMSDALLNHIDPIASR